MNEDYFATPSFAPSSTAYPLAISWLPPIGLVGLSVYNFNMRILTLGFYHFWGKTEVRQRIWSAMRIEGEPLAYTGTGRELLIGFLFVFAIILLPVMLSMYGVIIMFGPESTEFRAYQIALYAAFIFLSGIAIFRAQRYRLNRTTWRGIRAGLDGNSLRYGWTYFWTLLLMPLTLGWIGPWRQTLLQKIITTNMRYGDRYFRFSGSSGPLYKSYAVFWILLVVLAGALFFVIGNAWVDFYTVMKAEGRPTHLSSQRVLAAIAFVYGGLFLFGLVYMVLSSWYRAAMMRHFASYTHLEGLTFRSTVTARGLLWIALTNYLLLFFGAILATLAVAVIGAAAFLGLANYGIDPLGITTAQSPAQVIVAASGLITFIFILALGMMLPVTNARHTGYLVRKLDTNGTIDLAAVSAGQAQDIKRGEGLAQAFDIDAL
ncbi:MAG: YjgN family protein [Hyphomicrobiaceae bacterium]